MPKRWIDSDEWYPVYELTKTSVHGYAEGPFDISAKDLADYKRIMIEFNKMQKKLGKMRDLERDRRVALDISAAIKGKKATAKTSQVEVNSLQVGFSKKPDMVRTSQGYWVEPDA